MSTNANMYVPSPPLLQNFEEAKDFLHLVIVGLKEKSNCTKCVKMNDNIQIVNSSSDYEEDGISEILGISAFFQFS